MTTAMRKVLCASTVFAFFLYPAYLPAEIILPANPLAVERYAARELAYHVEKATGKRLAIAYEDEVPAASTERRFYVGATDAARRAGLLDAPFAMDEHHFKTIGRDFYFLGGDKDGRTMDNAWSATSHGTMYAVYDFLENEMGVRWLWPGPSGEVIPTMKEIPCVNADRRCKERLVNRYFRLLDRHTHGCIGWHELSNREKFDFEQRKFMLRHRNGVSRYITAGHAFVNWWDRYGKTHPEFFQERLDGKRGPYGNSSSDARNVTMCVSSPGLHKAIVSEWLLSGFKDPSKEHYSPFVGCLENDSPGMCLCERCRSWDVPDRRFEDSDFWSRRMKTITRRECWSQLARVMWGEAGGIAVCREPASVTDRYVKFYNAVLAEARKYDPNAQVTGFAYANYLEPPKKTRVPPS